MIEIGDRASLGQIRFGIFGLRDQLGVRHLDGDEPIQLLVVGQIDEAEAPFAQHFLDAVATNLLERLSGRSIIRRDGISLKILCHIVGVRVVQVITPIRILHLCRIKSYPVFRQFSRPPGR